jgi:hypothetical protein
MENYPELSRWPNVITEVLLTVRQEGRKQRGEMKVESDVGRWSKGPQAKKSGKWPETGKGKKTDSSLEAPEETQLFQFLDFSPKIPILDIWLLEL